MQARNTARKSTAGSAAWLQEPVLSIMYLTVLLAVRAGFQIYLFRRGFISVSADEFSRGIRAAKWSAAPGVDLAVIVRDLWLPFEKFLNGSALIVWPDVITTPRVTIFIASCLVIIAIYRLTHVLSESVLAAVVATLFASAQPWVIWLSGTPMLEMYYFAFLFLGLAVLVGWLKQPDTKMIWLAGLLFAVASGFHIQSWILINFINLLSLAFLFRFWQQGRLVQLRQLIGFYFVGNAFIFLFLGVEYLQVGTFLDILSSHGELSKWFYNGYDVSMAEKLLYYPNLINDNLMPLSWLLIGIGIVSVLAGSKKLLTLFPLAIALLTLIFSSVFNALSGPPSAAPGRYSTFYLLVFSIYVGLGVANLIGYLWNNRPQKNGSGMLKRLASAVPLLLIAIIMQAGISQALQFPIGIRPDAVKVGQELKSLLDDDPAPYMIELLFWDFLAVDLASTHFDNFHLDREIDYFNRDKPSMLMTADEADVRESLDTLTIKYIVLKDADLKQKAEESFGVKVKEVGDWAIFEVDRNRP